MYRVQFWIVNWTNTIKVYRFYSSNLYAATEEYSFRSPNLYAATEEYSFRRPNLYAATEEYSFRRPNLYATTKEYSFRKPDLYATFWDNTFESNMNSKKRIPYFDVAKGVLICLVIISHIYLETLTVAKIPNSTFAWMRSWQWIHVSFFMPAFFIITGLCSNFEKEFIW